LSLSFPAVPVRQLRDGRSVGNEACVDLASSSVCRIEIVSTRAGFDALETQWNALFERAARADQVFQNFNWLWHWANHFLNDKTELRVVTGWRDGRLAMVWPLVATKKLGITRLSWMGEPVSQYGDALVEAGPAAKAMMKLGWDQASRCGADFVLLRKTRASSVAASIIAPAMPCRTEAASVLDFKDATDFDDVLSRLSSRERSSRRRLKRRLLEKGAIVFRDSEDEKEKRALVKQAFELKRKWLVRRGRYSPTIESEATLSFFLDAASSVERPIGMPINAIYCDGQAIGIAFSLSCKDETVGYLIAHDTDFEKQGIGVLLVEHTLRSSFERNSQRFDMLAPRDAYKTEWSNDIVPVCDWILPLTTRGRLYAQFHVSALQRLLRAFKSLDPSIGRMAWPAIRSLKKIIQRNFTAGLTRNK
jgi:CelD/BcsL family acetyltransferase involved in cellulose biosynthesis